MKLNPSIESYILGLHLDALSTERKERLQPLIDFIQTHRSTHHPVVLQFICTHNSRRSQFAQIWAYAASLVHDIPVVSLSGGTEATAFHPNAIASIQRSGFDVSPIEGVVAMHAVSATTNVEALKVFSKRFDDFANAADDFAAVMTCADADENCPFIPGTSARIALNYQDPKVADGTSEEQQTYDARQRQIATEMLFVFSQIK